MRTEQGKRVLIVDNNEGILLTLQKMLETQGFDTSITLSGYEALEMLRFGEFDVLLVDDYLPDLHQHDFLSRVFQLPAQPWVVVMQATAPTPADLRDYATLGVFSVVRKHHIAEVCSAVSASSTNYPLAKVVSN